MLANEDKKVGISKTGGSALISKLAIDKFSEGLQTFPAVAYTYILTFLGSEKSLNVIVPSELISIQLAKLDFKISAPVSISFTFLIL